MLTVKMKEKISKLEFIYKGKTSNFDKYVIDLLIAADKYQIDSLKEQCEKKLIESIGIENCFSMLIMGDTYSLNIKKSALEFLIDNRVRIAFNEDLINHPSLMNEILGELFRK